MKRLFAMLCVLCLPLFVQAQADSQPFRARIYNKEYDVFMQIDFHNQSVIVPGQEMLGQLPGYLSKVRNAFCWMVLSAEVKKNVARITMVNDFGSEDLTATLTRENDSLYVLRQLDGSALKVPHDRKWQKLPKVLTFVRHYE